MLITMKAGCGEVLHRVRSPVALGLPMFERRPRRPSLRKESPAITTTEVLQSCQPLPQSLGILTVESHDGDDNCGLLISAFSCRFSQIRSFGTSLLNTRNRRQASRCTPLPNRAEAVTSETSALSKVAPLSTVVTGASLCGFPNSRNIDALGIKHGCKQDAFADGRAARRI